MGQDNRNTYNPSLGKKKEFSIGKWSVNLIGDIDYDGYYHIEHRRLTETNWVIHLMKKDWFIFNEFMPIFMQAHFNAGLKSVSFDLFY